MAHKRGAEESQITVEELRRAVLYLADAVLQLTRGVDTPAAWEAQERLRKAVEILVKLR